MPPLAAQVSSNGCSNVTDTPQTCRASHSAVSRVVRREGPAGWVCRYAAAALRSGWRLVRSRPGELVVFNYNKPLAPSARSAERLSAPSRADRLPRRTGAARRAQPVVAGIGLVRADSPPGVRPDAPRPEPALLRAGENPSCATCARYLSEANAPLFCDRPSGFFEGEPAGALPHTLRVGTVGQLTPAKGFGPHTPALPADSRAADRRGTHLRVLRPCPLARSALRGRTGKRLHPARTLRAGRPPHSTTSFFAYDPGGYRLTASGAIPRGALNLGRPVITLRNDCFDDVLRLPVGIRRRRHGGDGRPHLPSGRRIPPQAPTRSSRGTLPCCAVNLRWRQSPNDCGKPSNPLFPN